MGLGVSVFLVFFLFNILVCFLLVCSSVCLFYRVRERKGMDLDEGRGEEDLGGAGAGKQWSEYII